MSLEIYIEMLKILLEVFKTSNESSCAEVFTFSYEGELALETENVSPEYLMRISYPFKDFDSKLEEFWKKIEEVPELSFLKAKLKIVDAFWN